MKIIDKKWAGWTALYFLLVTGYIYLYIVDLNEILYPTATEEVKSKIDFVYSQF